jgi:hypothetical protein
MIFLLSKFHMSSSSVLLVIEYFVNIYYHTIFQDRTLNFSSVASTSKFAELTCWYYCLYESKKYKIGVVSSDLNFISRFTKICQVVKVLVV